MKRIIKISPNFTSDKLRAGTLLDRIDVYEDRVRGWLIDCGHILNQHEHAGFGVLQSGLAYFEGYAVFHRGEDSRNRSREFFQFGFESVFPDVGALSTPIREDFVDVICETSHDQLQRDGRSSISDQQSVQFRSSTLNPQPSIEGSKLRRTARISRSFVRTLS